MAKFKWGFNCIDNGGKRQEFTVTADSKEEAIMKALKKADKSAKGDIISWKCRLKLGVPTEFSGLKH